MFFGVRRTEFSFLYLVHHLRFHLCLSVCLSVCLSLLFLSLPLGLFVSLSLPPPTISLSYRLPIKLILPLPLSPCITDAPRSLTLSPSGVSPSINVVLAEPLSVTCGATCVPSCTFAWTKSGSSSSVSTTSLLNFSALGAGDSGTYTCTATNSKGSDTVSFQLVVDGVYDNNNNKRARVYR